MFLIQKEGISCGTSTNCVLFLICIFSCFHLQFKYFPFFRQIGADSGIKIGCYADDPHDHDLSYEPYIDPKVGMWPPMCIHHCFNHGYLYAGIQVRTLNRSAQSEE